MDSPSAETWQASRIITCAHEIEPTWAKRQIRAAVLLAQVLHFQYAYKARVGNSSALVFVYTPRLTHDLQKTTAAS